MHTEEEARKRKCPQMLINPSNALLDGKPCVASLCMAWRWGVMEGDPRKVGYCGLAGKP